MEFAKKSINLNILNNIFLDKEIGSKLDAYFTKESLTISKNNVLTLLDACKNNINNVERTIIVLVEHLF